MYLDSMHSPVKLTVKFSKQYVGQLPFAYWFSLFLKRSNWKDMVSTAYSCSLGTNNASSVSLTLCRSFSCSHTRMHKSRVSSNTCQCLCQTTPIFKCGVQGNDGPSSIRLKLNMLKDAVLYAEQVL